MIGDVQAAFVRVGASSYKGCTFYFGSQLNSHPLFRPGTSQRQSIDTAMNLIQMDKMIRSKLLLFLLVLGLVSPRGAVAQSWCPPGAVWHHDYFDGNGGVVGYVRTEYVGDTLVGGSLCQHLRPELIAYDQMLQLPVQQWLEPVFTRGQGDIVERWNGLDFDTLYWFGASPDDHWFVDSFGSPGLTVLDTGAMEVDGQLLSYLVVQFDEFPTGPLQDTLVERLGFLNYYFTSQSMFVFDIGFRWLRCYSDFDISYTKGTLPCNAVMSIEGIRSQGAAPVLYPNPGHDRIHFDVGSLEGQLHVRVFDGRGAEVLNVHLVDPEGGIDMSGFGEGHYTLLIRTAEGEVLHAKWTKQ